VTTIRPARSGDGADLAACWMDVGRYYAELAPEHFQVPVADGLHSSFEERLRQPHSDDQLWLVAEVESAVVASLTARLEPPHDRATQQFVRRFGEPRASIDALYVIGSHRRRGIGRQLMDAAERWALAKGAASITLDTYAGSPLSIPFYERGMGYQRRAIVFQKSFS
jgi:ribosomal protein S18 acetylase RimI-like enzyme